MQVIRVDHTDATAFHLLEKVAAAHLAHEKHDFEGLHIRSGGDHVHGGHDPRIIAVAKRGKQILSAAAGVLVCNDAIFIDNAGNARSLSDFFGEVVAFAELLANGAYNRFGNAPLSQYLVDFVSD